MRSIWQIYKTDWLNIFKVPTGIFLIVAICILPSLYAWVNIKSVWDPYANTEGVMVAVTSEDEGTTIGDKTINIGDELIHNLQNNHKLGWTFVDREEAERGLQRGEYYASILIPADFSSKMTGIIDGRLDRPEVIYSVNEKVNAIAPKITSSGVSTLAKQINENFTEAVSEALLTKLTEVGIKIEEQLPTIRKIEAGIFELESRLPEIHAAGQKVLELEQKLPAIHEKAQVILEVEKRIPQINQAAESILTLQKHWPQISDTLSRVGEIQDRLPAIQHAVARVQELDQNFDKVAGTIEHATDIAGRAIGIVEAAQAAIPRVEDIADKGAAIAERINAFLTKNEAAFQLIGPLVKQNLTLVQQAADATTKLTERLLQVDPALLPTAEEAAALRDRLAGAGRILEHTSSLLEKINSYLPGQPLDGLIDRLQSRTDSIHQKVQLLDIVAKALENGKTPARDVVERLHKLSQETSSVLGDILSRYDSEILPKLEDGIARLIDFSDVATEKIEAVQARLTAIDGVLADVKQGLEFGQTELQRITEQLPQIRARVHEAAVDLQQKADEFERVVNIAVPLIQENLPTIGKKLDQAAAFIQNDLPRAEQELSQLADFVRVRLPELELGVHRVASLVRDDLPQLERAVSQAADKLREVEANNNFAALAKLLRGDIQKESEFLASPVQIKENRLYPIPNYGSAMSPFYGVLSLWVGATLLISLLKAEADNPEGRYKPYQLYLGRLGTFLTIGQLQAISVSLGDMWILDAFVADKLPFVLFAMLVSAVFVTITYTLLSVFGNVGKGIAIIFMVFQFSSSGGTFPISMTAPFFQMLNPFMPFTYAISLLREAVGGIWWETAWRDILALLGFIGISLFVALVLKRPLSGIIKKSTENAKKTKIIA